MVRLVFSILLFIVLAVFIALNAQYTTTINFFSYIIEEVSVAAVVIITMAIGVIYSFPLYLSNYLARHRAERLKSQKMKNRAKADELAAREKELKLPAGGAPSTPIAAADENNATPPVEQRRRGRGLGLLRRKKASDRKPTRSYE
jgi:uncharacterized integral membrane protein